VDFKDKVVIVTGSGGGIGKVYAESFARLGAKVTVCDIIDCSETEKSIKAMGGEVLTLKTDITSEKDNMEMAKKTADRFGRIDVLVNNAAIWGGLKLQPFWEISTEDFDKLMDVNIKGMFLSCKAVIPFMKEQNKGKIVNIASIAAFYAPPFSLHYNVTKGAVLALTKTMAREVGDFNVTVNSVAPGLVSNDSSKIMIPSTEIDRHTATLCIKRYQQPEDLVGAVLFFSSEDSDFVTGQTLIVDGGCVFN